MGALYGAATGALASCGLIMMGAATFGAGSPWMVGGFVLVLMSVLCLIEWPDAKGGDGLTAAVLAAVCIVMVGGLASILLGWISGVVWLSKLPFVGSVAGFVMLIGAGWRGR